MTHADALELIDAVRKLGMLLFWVAVVHFVTRFIGLLDEIWCDRR